MALTLLLGRKFCFIQTPPNHSTSQRATKVSKKVNANGSTKVIPRLDLDLAPPSMVSPALPDGCRTANAFFVGCNLPFYSTDGCDDCQWGILL